MNDDVNEDMNANMRGNQSGTTAVSIFDEAGAAGEFPVLKAFQQYIDAEQAKARKRMVWLSAFFMALLIAVVLIFSLIMAAIISKDQQNLTSIAAQNQMLSDKLLDFTLKNAAAGQTPIAAPRPESSQTAANPAETMNPVLNRLSDLVEQVSAMQTRQQQPVQPVYMPMPPAPAAVPTAAESAEVARLREELRKQREALSSEREKLKTEQEKLRQEEIERHRRRLYPEYYAREDARKAGSAVAPAAAPKAPAAVPEAPAAAPKAPDAAVPAEPVAPVPAADLERRAPAPLPAATPAKSVPAPQPAPAVVEETKPALPRPPAPSAESSRVKDAKPVDISSTKPVSYFEEEDEDLKNLVRSVGAPKPVEAPAAETPASTPGISVPQPEALNIGGKDGAAVPFLIELPAAK